MYGIWIVCYQRPVFTRHVRTTTAAGLSVSRHLKAHIRCSSVVGFLADRTNGHAIGTCTVLRLSSVVCHRRRQ